MNLVKGGEVENKGIGKIVICTPTLDGQFSLEYMVSMLETIGLLHATNVLIDCAFVRGDAFISKARNNLINQFLKRQADHLFFIDADQGWDANSFLRMILDPHEIVAAAVVKKQDEVQFNNVDLVTNLKGDCSIENGMLETKTVGTGFMRIKKSAIDKMIAAYPETYIPGDGSEGKHYQLFETKIIEGQFWGEDLVFCKKWCALGEKIWIDPNVTMTHIGRKAWQGNFLEYLQKNCKVEIYKPQQLAA